MSVEIRINPRAEPARSAVYTDEEIIPFSSFIVSLLNRVPVMNEGGKTAAIMRTDPAMPETERNASVRTAIIR